MKNHKRRSERIVLALLLVIVLFVLGCSGGDNGGDGDGYTDLMGTWNGSFFDTWGGLGTDNSASVVINFQDASGFAGTATVFSNSYAVGGSIDEPTGEIGMLLTPTAAGIKIAMAATLTGDVLSGQWANADNPVLNGGTFSVSR